MGAREPPAARLPAMTTHGPRSARTRTTALGRGISAVRLETLLFPLAIGVIAMDVIDRPLVPARAGDRRRDHLVSGLVPPAVLGPFEESVQA
jgi:hypothetical protein